MALVPLAPAHAAPPPSAVAYAHSFCKGGQSSRTLNTKQEEARSSTPADGSVESLCLSGSVNLFAAAAIAAGVTTEPQV